MFPELERRLEELQAALGRRRKARPASAIAPSSRPTISCWPCERCCDRMIELEDFNEAVDLLRGIIKMQEQLREQTQQRHKQKIRELLKE